MTADSRRSLVARLHTVEGHLRAVTRLVKEELDPEQVLHQLDAVQGAVRSIQSEVLLDCVKSSLEIIEKEGCPEKSSLQVDRIDHLFRTHKFR